MAAMASLFVKAFVKRISDDFKQRELLPLKLLFFVHASTVFVLYPYLTIHMRELGINVKETAIMSAVTPVVAIIMPPLAGMVADRIGNFKILLATFSTLGGAVALCLLLVPAGRIVVPYPERAPLELGCAVSATGEDSWTLALRRADADTVPCSSVASPHVSARTEACGLVCDPPPAAIAAASLTHFTVTVRRPGATANDSINYTLDPDLKIKGDSHFRTEARALTDGRLFLPAEGLVDVRCDAAGCALGSTAGWPSSATLATSSVGPPAALFSADLGLVGKSSISSIPHNTTLFLAATNLTTEAGTHIPTKCRDLDQEAGVRFGVDIIKDDEIIELSGCSSRCLVGVARKELCTDVSRVVELDVELTFWLYLVIRVFIGIVGGTAFAMFEGAVIAILREHSADYGLQRIYATIGGMISSPLSGMLIDWASAGKDYADFRPAFYLYAALKIISGLLILTINLEFKAPAKNIVADVMTVMKNIELVALMVVVFVLGTAWGFIESFLFWLLQDLGGTRSLMGITITVGGIAGIPLLVLSGPIIDRFGHANVLTFGFLFYAIRLLGYSLIYNPWLCLIFEAMESVTSSLSITAAVTYAAKLSTSTTDTSVQGLLGGLYFGVGKGAGSLIGGYMMTWVGTRPTYQIFAAACTVVGCAYFLTHKMYLGRRPDRACNDIVKTKSTFLGGEKPPKDKADKVSKAEKGENEKDGKMKATEGLPINKAAPRSYSTDEATKEATEAEKNAHNAALSANLALASPATEDDVSSSCRVNLAFQDDDDQRKAA